MKSDSKSKMEMPSELREALAGDPVARAAFDKLAPSHRKQYAGHINEAKQAGTRRRMAQNAIEMLRMIRPA